jgi:hypothetical protein
MLTFPIKPSHANHTHIFIICTVKNLMLCIKEYLKEIYMTQNHKQDIAYKLWIVQK